MFLSIKKNSLFNFFLAIINFDPQEKIKYEEKVSQNINSYIGNDLIVKLPIPVLHRILSRTQSLDQTKIENFLIKALSKRGKRSLNFIQCC